MSETAIALGQELQMLMNLHDTSHELTVNRFGYGPAVIEKLSRKDDFTDVKIFHTITSPPLDKQQLDPSNHFPISAAI